jgi:type IV fimbrial biogenesis protein FimT
MRSRQLQSGFTLLELMITVSLLAVLLGLAVPAFQSAALGSQLRAAANELVASAYLARSEAIKRNTVVTLCVSSDGVSCGSGNWEQGWIVHSGTTLQRQTGAPPGLKITAGGVTSLSFQPTGAGATPAVFTVCRTTPAGNQERVVTIDATGRPWAKATTTGVC